MPGTSCICPGIIPGQSKWRSVRDKEGYTDYYITHKVVGDCEVGTMDGPYNILNLTAGLGIPGVSAWLFDGDSDANAICAYDAEVGQLQAQEDRNPYWEVTQRFSDRPDPNCIRRQGTGTGNLANDPLSWAPKVSGNFNKYTEEKEFDRFGGQITNSAFERIRGSGVEFDSSRAIVRIQQNEATLDLATKVAIIDTVNSAVLWGFAARMIKLSTISWERKFYAGCSCYFEVNYDFEINPNGWDRELLDEATKVLSGKWNVTTGAWDLVNIGGGAPNPSNPTHFIRLTDLQGNPMRGILNGAGIPCTNASGTASTDPGRISVEYYPETDFYVVLGIPTSLEC